MRDLSPTALKTLRTYALYAAAVVAIAALFGWMALT